MALLQRVGKLQKPMISSWQTKQTNPLAGNDWRAQVTLIFLDQVHVQDRPKYMSHSVWANRLVLRHLRFTSLIREQITQLPKRNFLTLEFCQ